MKLNKLIFSAFALLFGLSANAQINKVGYAMEFNNETCLFDCYLVVEDGYARTLKERAQFNAQYTLVSPANSIVTIEETYMPLEDNQFRSGNKAAQWNVSNIVNAPAAAPSLAYHSVVPQLSPSAFYNDVNQGDRVKLFSVSVTPMVDCAKDVRIFVNTEDPTSADTGMNGGDYSNGFTVGGIGQKFSGSTEVVAPSAPLIKGVNGSGLVLELDQLAECQSELDFLFYGPQGEVSKEAFIKAANRGSNGYKAIVKDGLGCSSEFNTGSKLTDNNVTTANNGDVDNTSNVVLSENNTETVALHSQVFPNPTVDVLNLVVEGYKGQFNVHVADISGKVLVNNALQGNLTGNDQFKMPLDLNSGLYVLSLNVAGETVQTHKFLVVK